MGMQELGIKPPILQLMDDLLCKKSVHRCLVSMLVDQNSPHPHFTRKKVIINSISALAFIAPPKPHHRVHFFPRNYYYHYCYLFVELTVRSSPPTSPPARPLGPGWGTALLAADTAGRHPGRTCVAPPSGRPRWSHLDL